MQTSKPSTESEAADLVIIIDFYVHLLVGRRISVLSTEAEPCVAALKLFNTADHSFICASDYDKLLTFLTQKGIYLRKTLDPYVFCAEHIDGVDHPTLDAV